MDPASWQEVKDVIVEAMRLPPSERARFVRERCSDPRVAAEILALLGDRGAEPADGDATMEYALGIDLEPGTRIGPYVVIDTIGRGAMGQVFLVSDPRLRRRVALKCVLGRDDQRARILHEARAAARVSHPNVAAIHDVVEHDDRAFIVMEYVEGETLAARLRRERMPIGRAIAVGRQLASALAAAHAKGVVHRDLKPGNIQLTPDGSIKVLDFGIANAPLGLTTPAATEAATSTVSMPAPPSRRSSDPGTPPYMAPEQLLGQPADERTDIYSLGIVLFEMLTRRRPYVETTRPALIAAHELAAPRADIVDAGVPHPLADIVARTLAIDPAQRYQTADEVIAALAEVDETLQRPGRGPLEQAVRWTLGIVASGCGAVAFVLLLGFVNTLVFDVAVGSRGFSSHPLSNIWTFGQRSIVAPLALVVMACGAIWAVLALGRLAQLVPIVSDFVIRTRQLPRVSTLRSFATNPTLVARVASLAAIVGVVLVFWRFQTVVTAWQTPISEAPADALATLANHEAQSNFRFYMSLVVVATGVALVYIVRLRAREGRGRERGSLYACIAVLAVAVIVNDAPYRLVYDTARERVVLDGQRCYAIAEAPARVLLFCPDMDPPRNRIAGASDPALRRTGIEESIFTKTR